MQQIIPEPHPVNPSAIVFRLGPSIPCLSLDS
ncbi:hypothetical protein CPAR01_14737 [Colletotrichum paranaense]|uniref:Uncharacterized protein n=1 Tax=Colletotrichum paranaense TaxID=1914294 RepID=A0ABQ9S1A5_9PEZI|nr:uncharacterized protein CPAR01_14737 [Colletotrichum paranaense]KAK1521820.1 hypothetical protein CPAR01_14737 [Colletotrichum paranaense]